MTSEQLKSEPLRYLGMCDALPDDELIGLIDHALERLEKVADKRFVTLRSSLCIDEKGVWIGAYRIESDQLRRHLEGCEDVLLFAATLGADVDRLLRRDAISKPSLAMVEQAAAAAMIEQYSDELCERMENDISDADERYHLRPRFSPGYGDFSLEEQVFILRMLNAYKRIGITHTEHYMLTPMKSITAVIGIAKGALRCYSSGCQMCSKTDCAFRKSK